MSCWHPSVQRCERCMLEDPAAAAPPIPFERRDLSVAKRYFATLATAFSPIRSAPAFASHDVRSALRFGLLTMVPLALLAGVVPYTRTLLFEHLAIKVVGQPSGLEIGADVVRAMLIEAGLSAVRFGCLFLPYVTLVRAYAPAERRNAAIVAMLYRGWLLPAGRLFFYVALWTLPPAEVANTADPPALWFFVLAVDLAARVLMMMTMGATARLACGLGPFMAFVVVIVPVMLQLLVDPLVSSMVEHILPAMPASGPLSTSAA
jgi:hypothetical protein